MAASITITRNKTLPNSSDKADFHDLVDTATASISGIDQTDLGAGVGLVVRQATAPSDTDQIWVDTSVTPYVVRIHDGTEWIATGGYVVMTNKSGGQRTLGDVCVIDTANDGAFTTTTLYGDPRHVVVVMETIDDSSDGVVAISGGRVTNLKVDSAVTNGDWLATASTAGRAAKSFVNSFGTALASIGGSGTLSEALLNRNSLSVLANASIPASGTSGQFLQTLGAGANLVWSDLFTIASGQNTSDFGMTASSYTDVTSVTTGAFTAKAGIAIITVNAVYGLRTSFTLAVTDGSNNVIATTGANNVGIGGSPIKEGISFTFLTTLSAGSNTLKLRYKLDDGETTGTLYGTKSPTIIQVAYIG